MQFTNGQQRIALPQKRRGALLSVFIGFQLVVNVIGVLLYFAVGGVFLGHLPAWIVVADLIIFVGLTAGFLATLRWKRIGAYSVLVFYLVQSLENLMLGRTFGVLVSLGSAAVFAFLLRFHWNDLD